MGGDDSQKLLPWRGIHSSPGRKPPAQLRINNVTETAGWNLARGTPSFWPRPQLQTAWATFGEQRRVNSAARRSRAHERLSGPATRHILEREYARFGKAEYARLAKISIGHLYNLRASGAYRKRLAVYESTRPTVVTIGERRRPEPRGQAGYLQVDTVHQGDWNGAKGVYHINAVDAVTQWQVVGLSL